MDSKLLRIHCLGMQMCDDFHKESMLLGRRKFEGHIQSYAAFGNQIIHLYIVDMLQGLLYKDCLCSCYTSTANY